MSTISVRWDIMLVAYHAGHQAGRVLMPREWNPYTDTFLRCAWQMGWFDGRRSGTHA